MKRASGRALFLSVLLAAAPAWAQDATQQAKTMFNAGAQAYEAGQFPAAIQAFTEAYRLSPRPGILFSMAQARRKQYYVDKQPAQLREAIKLYRDYVTKVEQGGRRSDAVQALAELEPVAEKLGGAMAAAPPVAAEAKPATRLMVSAGTKEAAILLDGKPIEASVFVDVKPDKHTVRVTAAGYVPEEREVKLAEGGIVAIDVPMREQPGLLSVNARDGSDVSIDGRLAATTPLGRPIELSPGPHFVAVTKRGYKASAQELEIGRGESKTLTVPLEVTSQRIGAYTLVGVAVAGAVAGGVLAGVAISEQGQAQALDTKRKNTGGLTGADLTAYQDHVSTRNSLRTATGVTLGGATVVGLTAIFLAVFDQPVVGVGGGSRRDDRSRPAAPPPRERPMEMSAAPILGPGFYGAALGGRF